MFENIKMCDTVLVTVYGKSENTFDEPEKFLIPATVTSHTPARFVVGGVTYKKSDGYSYPAGNGRCQVYNEIHDETKNLMVYNVTVEAIKKTNDLLFSLCRLRVKRGTRNLHTILKAAETLAALLDRGSAL